jgi:uncharacterized protein YprB with RNaseH-like and TPR domain
MGVMSDVLARLKALKGELDAEPAAAANAAARRAAGVNGLAHVAAQLQAQTVESNGHVFFVRDEALALPAAYGRVDVQPTVPHGLLARGISVPDSLCPEDVLYVDTETTGLAGGAGTLAFLIGVAFVDGGALRVRQWLLPGPQHEAAVMRDLAAFASRFSVVVSYNGASFDLPLLRNRFALHGHSDPWAGAWHVDLLHAARRLYKGRFANCALQTIERHVLGQGRSHTDIPGREVPERYRAFLRTPSAALLEGIVEHNRQDVVMLAALLGHVNRQIVSPPPELSARVGRWQVDVRDVEVGLATLLAAADVDQEAAWEAASVLKRQGRFSEAAELWLRLGEAGWGSAWLEIAKVEEHRFRRPREALAATERAARLLGDVPEVRRRRKRLHAKVGR